MLVLVCILLSALFYDDIWFGTLNLDVDPTFINATAMDNQYYIFIVFFYLHAHKLMSLANVNILFNYVEYPANGFS